MLLRAIHQGTSRAATRKLPSGAGQPTITLRTFLDGTHDGSGISESSGASEEAADPQAAQLHEQPATTPVDVEGVAAATPKLLRVGRSSRLHRAGVSPSLHRIRW